MSSRESISITCPNCKKQHPFTIWKSINTTLDPSMRQAVRDQSAFLFTCPTCGTRHYIDYGFLYHQMEDRIMIHYANSDENAEEIYSMLTANGTESFSHFFTEHNYLIRIVRTKNQLLEKLAIFDAGLDDRIIEIFKVFVLAQFQKQHTNHAKIELLFFYSENNKNLIQIIADGKPAGVANVEPKAYDLLVDNYKSRLADIRKDGPYIDRQWALDMIKKYPLH